MSFRLKKCPPILSTLSVTAVLMASAGNARAQQNWEQADPAAEAQWGASAAEGAPTAPGYAEPTADTGYGQDAYEGTPLIPPNVEGAPYPAADGGYCYVGPHPVDTRVVPGSAWDATAGQHVRPYPPVDTRLFAFRDGCYYFTGDPRDFGYAGQTYAYYGAHPVLDVYGGGWCFMMGGHTHLWQPWSPYFTVVGPWYYWHGAYDPFFWAYWPYYSFYYRSYYPHYYGGGRFYRGGGYRVAPPIRSVPASAWRGGARVAPTVRGSAPPQMYQRSPMQASPQRGYGSPGPARPSFSSPAAPRPGFSSPGASRPSFSSPGAPRPSFSPPARSFSPPQGGGFGSHGSFHGGGGRR